MRMRFWFFAAVVAAALAANLALVSARFVQNADEALGSRLAVASAGVRTQIELLDLRTSPRTAAFSPELIEATRPLADASQPARPDERALRAAAAALQPEPDLLVLSTAHGAAVSRRGKAASLAEDPGKLPLVRLALEGGASPQFVTVEGKLYRASAVRIPGSAAVVMTGTLVDDRFAAQLRSLVDADVSFLQQGAVVASSLATGDRPAAAAWAKAPGGGGFGTLPVELPGVGSRFTGQLPLGAPHAATRAALTTLGQGVQAAVSVPAAPYLEWLARYQAFYVAAWGLFVLVAFVWGLFAGSGSRAQAAGRPAPVGRRADEEAGRRSSERASGSARAAPEPSEVPWSDEPVEPPARAAARGHEPLDPELPARGAQDDEPQLGPLPASASGDPMWSGDELSASGGAAGNLESAPGELELAGELPARAGPRQREDLGPSAESPGLGAGWGDSAAGGAPAPAEWGAVDPGAAEPWPEPEAQPPPAAPPKPPAAKTPPAKALAQKDVTLTDFSLPGTEDQDPDEAHFRETFDKFMALRSETGESGNLSYEKFVAKLRQNREQLLSRGTARAVRFTVYKKDGRAAIKASAVR